MGKPNRPFIDKLRGKNIPNLKHGDDLVANEDEVVYLVSKIAQFDPDKCDYCLGCASYLYNCFQSLSFDRGVPSFRSVDVPRSILVGVYDDEVKAKSEGGPGCIIKCVARNGECKDRGLWHWMEGKHPDCKAIKQGLITVSPTGNIVPVKKGLSSITISGFLDKDEEDVEEVEEVESYKKSGFEFI